jgi:hypothetical protein
MTSDHAFFAPAPEVDGDPSDGRDFYRVHLFETPSGAKPMKKIGETWARCERRGLRMTHHVFLDAGGRHWRIPWRDLLVMAPEGAAKRAYLRSVKAMAIANDVKRGAATWPEALSRLDEMEPTAYRPGDGEAGCPPKLNKCGAAGGGENV